jgi:hypothetical protein
MLGLSTTVKLNGSAKALLERLQSRIELFTGRRLSQQKIVETIITISAEQDEEILDRLAGVRLPSAIRDLEAIIKSNETW